MRKQKLKASQNNDSNLWDKFTSTPTSESNNTLLVVFPTNLRQIKEANNKAKKKKMK